MLPARLHPSYVITAEALRNLLDDKDSDKLLSAKIADGITFRDLIKHCKITEATLRLILKGISRRETEAEKESRNSEESNER